VAPLGRRRLAAVAVSGAVALCGSRRLPPAGQALAGRVARGVLASGRPLVLGCCTGADAAALAACPPGSAVRVLAAFGPGGAGAGRHSAVAPVAAFAAAGGAVSWWAGGGSAVPLAWRLAARTRAVVQAGSGGLVAVFGAPGSRGSLLACRAAAGQGSPVLAFPVGFRGELLPVLGAGAWVPAGGAGVWAGAWRWRSAHTRLC
jgi:predicted Rossmann fold nucleotide-binding protein DprA/Smf involved in DNA uptake